MISDLIILLYMIYCNRPSNSHFCGSVFVYVLITLNLPPQKKTVAKISQGATSKGPTELLIFSLFDQNFLFEWSQTTTLRSDVENSAAEG